MSLGRSISLSLAAIPVLISGAAMAFGDHDGEALCGGRRYARIAIPHGASPYVELAADGKSGPFLIDYGATRSALSVTAFPGPEGHIRKATISLPGIEEAFFHLARYDLLLQPEGGQFGVVGGDLLSRLSVQLTPAAVIVGAEPCRAEALIARGLTPVAETSFFGSDPAKVDPGRPDVPVVFVRLGKVRAFAQIDTGYEDLAHGRSVDVNQAFFERLVESGIKLDRVSEVDLWTCEGRERWPVYRARDQILTIENEQGEQIIETGGFHLIVKQVNGCGGIAEMTEPAAQLGASFLELFDTIVFDPKNAIVWFAAAGARASGEAPSSAEAR
jgi:hypothetical protein